MGEVGSRAAPVSVGCGTTPPRITAEGSHLETSELNSAALCPFSLPLLFEPLGLFRRNLLATAAVKLRSCFELLSRAVVASV